MRLLARALLPGRSAGSVGPSSLSLPGAFLGLIKDTRPGALTTLTEDAWAG